VVLSGNLVVGNLSREPYGLPAGATYFHVTSGLMVSCTIAMNQHFGVSRGHAQEDLNAENCVIWGNEDGAVQPGSCTVSYSCLDEEEPGEGNIFDDPLFMDPEKGDFRLRQGSPCIDAGNNDVLNLPETDILGAPRIVFGGRSRTLDMGAYEYVPLTITKDALGVTLTWGSVPGKTYEIYYAGDLLRYSLAHTVLAVGPVTSWTDERLKTVVAPLRFYRILENP
jgi:hypothetical protein